MLSHHNELDDSHPLMRSNIFDGGECMLGGGEMLSTLVHIR
jgi:hypothetical protein